MTTANMAASWKKARKNSSNPFADLEVGIYKAWIVGAAFTKSKKGKDQVCWSLFIASGPSQEGSTKKFWNMFVTEKDMGFFAQKLAMLGKDLDSIEHGDLALVLAEIVEEQPLIQFKMVQKEQYLNCWWDKELDPESEDEDLLWPEEGAAEASSKASLPTPEEEPEVEEGEYDLDALGEDADGEDANDSIETLTELAGNVSLNPEDYPTWAGLAEAIATASAELEPPEADEVEEEPEEEPEEEGLGAHEIDELGEKADEEEEGAQTLLEGLAEEAGLDPLDFPLWTDLSNELNKLAALEDGNPEVEEDFTIDDWVWCHVKGKVCTGQIVNIVKGVASVKNKDTNRIFKKPVEDLQAAETPF